jgi:hypothetical protein
MKAFLVVLLFAAVALAQDPSAITSAESACGSREIKFDAKLAANQHPTPQPEPGKALVYVIEDLGQCSGCSAGSNSFFTQVDHALTRVGMDGSWAGANHGSSYIFFAADPGEHHLCINWQSRLEIRSRAFAMANFRAEEGKTYYFRERVFPGHDDYSFDLDPLNDDQGKYLIAISAFSASHPKK